jgi:dolichyl-phosphate beta-glucosyltransferase
LSHPFLSIILPAHNEESRLPKSLQLFEQFLGEQSYTSEVIVVENGSSDRTFEIAKAFEGRLPGLKVIHEEQSGKGRAIQRGMLESCGDFRFYCDVDLSMPITEINYFLPPKLEQFDIAIASREAPGAIRYNEPAYRHLAGRIFNTLVRWAALPGLQDTQCGFKCFRAAAADEIFRHQTMMGWSFDVEVLFIGQCWGYKIVEVPIPWYYYPGSQVHLFRDAWRMVSDIMTIRRNNLRGLYDRKV